MSCCLSQELTIESHLLDKAGQRAGVEGRPVSGTQHACKSAEFHCPTMKQFVWQDDIVRVAKFVSEGLYNMLGADSDAQSQASDQP
jgi:hypothetical protein